MSKLKIRLTTAALSALVALLLVPALGEAATTFGSRFKNEPTDQTCKDIGPCTIVSFTHPIDPNGDPYSGGAPVDGVITKFKAQAYANDQPGQLTFRIAEIVLPDPNNKDSALASAKGTGPTVTVPVVEGGDPVPFLEAPGRVPVKAGQHLAVDITPTVAPVYNSNGSVLSYSFAPPLVEGAGPRGSTEGVNELLVAATIEPDADKDGFGDETQDQCPRQATTQGACDDTKPGVDGLKVTNGEISYTLSEGATVSFLLEKKKPGRKVGKKCVKQTAANKSKKRCSTLVKIGAEFPGGGAVGFNKVTLPNGKKLKPGGYRLTITVRDAAGNETKSTANFSVKKKKKRKK